MKVAAVAVSKRGLDLAGELLKLYPGVNVYVPQRFLCLDKNHTVNNEKAGQSSVKVNESDRGSDRPKGIRNLKIEQTADSGKLDPSEKRFSNYPGNFLPLEGDFTAAIAAIFKEYDAIIFITAVAVAVRGIASCLVSKAKDPAVVVVDEGGHYAISLLSGHLGGANQLTGEIAEHLGAEAVVTTATDGQGLPAFDDLARRYGWQIENLTDLKKISAALLEGREIFLYSSRPLYPVFKQALGDKICFTEQPEDLARAENGVVLVTNSLKLPELPPGLPYITLRPRTIAAGVGCRRGVPAEDIIAAVKKAFNQAGFSAAGLACLATGEFKVNEAGLIEAAEQLGVPLKIFRREEIAAALGDSTTSEFVEEQVGVGAVAEPCARLGSGGGDIILPVQRGSGITISLAEAKTIGTG